MVFASVPAPRFLPCVPALASADDTYELRVIETTLFLLNLLLVIEFYHSDRTPKTPSELIQGIDPPTSSEEPPIAPLLCCRGTQRTEIIKNSINVSFWKITKEESQH